MRRPGRSRAGGTRLGPARADDHVASLPPLTDRPVARGDDFACVFGSSTGSANAMGSVSDSVSDCHRACGPQRRVSRGRDFGGGGEGGLGSGAKGGGGADLHGPAGRFDDRLAAQPGRRRERRRTNRPAAVASTGSTTGASTWVTAPSATARAPRAPSVTTTAGTGSRAAGSPAAVPTSTRPSWPVSVASSLWFGTSTSTADSNSGGRDDAGAGAGLSTTSPPAACGRGGDGVERDFELE